MIFAANKSPSSWQAVFNYGPYLITFAAGIVAAVLTNYFTWAAEIRRRGLDALLGLYAEMVSATDEVSNFIGRWRGVRAIDLGYQPDHPDRPEVREFWDARGKLVRFKILIYKASPFLNKKQKERVFEEWKQLWDGFHDSGDDVKKDLEFQKRIWGPAEGVAAVIRENFMTVRGFIRTIFHGAS